MTVLLQPLHFHTYWYCRAPNTGKVRNPPAYKTAAFYQSQPSENSGLHWFSIFEVFTLQEYIDLMLFSIADYIDAVDNDL